MMAVTHALISAAGVCLFCQTSDPLAMGLSIVGSQLPDLDSTKSLIGQMFFPVSEYLETRYPHRTITHSLLFTLALILISFGLWFVVSQKIDLAITTAIALPLGHLLAIFSDTFTKQGVQLFYPLSVWCVCGKNPRRRLRTGGNAEFIVIGLTVIVLAIALNLNYQGGLQKVARDNLNLKDGTIGTTYNQRAANTIIWADFQGYHAGDRRPINDRFLVIAEDGGFVLMGKDNQVYRVGKEVIEEKINLIYAQPAQITQVSQTFDDAEISGVLQRLKATYPDSLILLSGSVNIDYPETARSVHTLEISGSTAKLDQTHIDLAIAAIGDQWGIGTLTAKIFTPDPWRITPDA